MNSQRLPIDDYLEQIKTSLEQNNNLVLQASPGSGKTTRVPPALLSARFINPQKNKIIILEPRRLAAKMAALRVTQELELPLGQVVGYQFRFENTCGPQTQLQFLTEGLLLRRLMHDPLLENVAAVLIDEFHERHLQTDLAVSALRTLQKGARPDLRLVVMSATLPEPQKILEFLNSTQFIDLAIPQYPLEINYLTEKTNWALPKLVKNQLRQAIAKPDHGHVLIFLSGQAEINKTLAELQASFNSEAWPYPKEEFILLPLYGNLTQEEQSKVFSQTTKIKIILATNIAESSLTIDGVRTVIDSGLHKQSAFSNWSGLPSLQTVPISKASAIQRAGRAARNASGRCFRLYTSYEFEQKKPSDTPEILRADLTQTLLELQNLKIGSKENFSWFARPNKEQIQQSFRLLVLLGAFLPTGELTALGQKMAQLPVPPRLAKFLITANNLGLADLACFFAAHLSEANLPHEANQQITDIFEWWDMPSKQPNVLKLNQQLRNFFKTTEGQTSKNSQQPSLDLSTKQKIARCFWEAYPDRVAQLKRNPSSKANSYSTQAQSELLLCQGGHVPAQTQYHPLDGEWFVLLDIEERKSAQLPTAKNIGRILCVINEDWLLEGQPETNILCPTLMGELSTDLIKIGFLLEKNNVLWDEKFQKVVYKEQLLYGQLTLLESITAPKENTKNEEAALLFLKNILPSIKLENLSTYTSSELILALSPCIGNERAQELETLLVRYILIKDFPQNQGIAEVSSVWLLDFLKKATHNTFSVNELKTCHWLERLQQHDAEFNWAMLDTQAPVFWKFANGRKSKVHYELGKKPYLASRIQDFLGIKNNPALFQNKILLVLHLLAPNQRAVQVTTDLMGFWQRGYLEVRKELMRKYPRHAWPENPLEILRD